MSEPLDPVTAGLASVLKSLRTRAGLTEDRLAGTEIALDTLTGLGRVGEFMAAGSTSSQAIIEAVKAAAGSLEPTYSIVADVSLGLRLARDPLDADLYATDLGRRRAALVKNWDRMHELRSAVPAVATPTLRTLRLEIETAAFNALASALTDAGSLWSSSSPPAQAAASGADIHDHTGPGARGGAGDGDPDRSRGGTAPPPLVRSQTPLLLDEFGRIAGALRDSLMRDTDRSGWPHDLRKGSKPVTPLSSSYGIKAMLLLEGSLPPDLIPVAEYLGRAAEEGGYAAHTQLEPRPEVTATVLETLHRINGTAKFDEQITRIKANLGGFEKTRPFILTCLLEASVQLGDDGLTRSLVEDLLAVRRPYGRLLLWPEKVEEDLVDPVASIAHTARAVRALVQASRPAARSIEPPEGAGGEVAEAIDQAAAWLAGQQDLNNVSEVIDRQLTNPNRVEQVYVRHFTAAWVVKALVSAGLPASHPSVSAAVIRVWADYSNDAALWSWSNGDLPVWMTFDAVDALRLASLAATIQSGGSGAS